MTAVIAAVAVVRIDHVRLRRHRVFREAIATRRGTDCEALRFQLTQFGPPRFLLYDVTYCGFTRSESSLASHRRNSELDMIPIDRARRRGRRDHREGHEAGRPVVRGCADLGGAYRQAGRVTQRINTRDVRVVRRPGQVLERREFASLASRMFTMNDGFVKPTGTDCGEFIDSTTYAGTPDAITCSVIEPVTLFGDVAVMVASPVASPETNPLFALTVARPGFKLVHVTGVPTTAIVGVARSNAELPCTTHADIIRRRRNGDARDRSALDGVIARAGRSNPTSSQFAPLIARLSNAGSMTARALSLRSAASRSSLRDRPAARTGHPARCSRYSCCSTL